MGKIAIVYSPDAKEILSLHHETKLSTLECRRALVQSDGNLDMAKELLAQWREQQKNRSWIELYR